MVNAALTTQLFVDKFYVNQLIFSGIAGGVDPSNNIGWWVDGAGRVCVCVWWWGGACMVCTSLHGSGLDFPRLSRCEVQATW